MRASELQIQIWIHWMWVREWGVNSNYYLLKSSAKHRKLLNNVFNKYRIRFLIDMVKTYRFICQCWNVPGRLNVCYVDLLHSICILCIWNAKYGELDSSRSFRYRIMCVQCLAIIFHLKFTKAINLRCLMFNIHSIPENILK